MAFHSAFTPSRLFAVVLAAGSAATALLWWLAPAELQIAFVALLAVVLCGLTAAGWAYLRTLSENPYLISLPMAVANDTDVLDVYRSMAGSLCRVAGQPAPVYRDLALQRLAQLDRDLAQVSNGRFVFESTETWRMTYEQLLRSPGLYRYRSISFFKTTGYWQDDAAWRSMQLNFELAGDQSVRIERVVIVPDELWPVNEKVPIDPVHSWIDEQHRHGIAVMLVRQSTIADEPDLAVDLGIYGSQAVGMQEVDQRGRTVRFTLSFDFSEVLAAENRWDRLAVYGVFYARLLDQADLDVYDPIGPRTVRGK